MLFYEKSLKRCQSDVVMLLDLPAPNVDNGTQLNFQQLLLQDMHHQKQGTPLHLI
jgi:hypothetical protein